MDDGGAANDDAADEILAESSGSSNVTIVARD
jgi:hypothetical protein